MTEKCKPTAPAPAEKFMSTAWDGVNMVTLSNGEGNVPLNNPPRRGPAIAEQLQVILNAIDHFGRFCTSTISDVMTQTELTIPPPPIPAKARAEINLRDSSARKQWRL
jgi:hypothetical protein